MSIKNDLVQKKHARVEIGVNMETMAANLRKLVADPTQSEEVVKALNAQLELIAAVQEYFVGEDKLDKEIERIYSKILS